MSIEAMKRARAQMQHMLWHGEWYSPELVIDELDAAISSAERAEPVAWAMFSDSGNIRLWGPDRESAERWASKRGGRAVPLFAFPLGHGVPDDVSSDAARYRWLRDHWHGFEHFRNATIGGHPITSLDKEVDQQLRAAGVRVL